MRMIFLIFLSFFLLSSTDTARSHRSGNATATASSTRIGTIPPGRPYFLPTLADTFTIQSWLVAGPFSIGAREGSIEPIEEIESLVPKEGEEVRDILTEGGIVRWKRIESKDRVTKLEFPEVEWDTLQDIYGVPGLLNLCYAYGEVEVEEDLRALALAERVGSFFLNGKPFPGSVYGDPYFLIPIILKKGKNHILVKVSGFGDQQFTFKFLPAPAPVFAITHDATVPDIIVGAIHESPQKGWIGIPIMNTTSERLKEITLTVGTEKKTIPSLMPLSVLKVPMWMEELDTTLSISVVGAGLPRPYEGLITLRKRKPGESFKATFLSKIDNSCQYYAVLPPVGATVRSPLHEGEKYNLILTLHGAGVEASGQVDAYTPKDWAFIVAPTNRRRYGFDWQDWGRLDALEVLEDVKENYPIDENRIYLTGHSMGGHGTYHIGLAHPDLFAALAPSAGWTSFQLYIPWSLQRSSLYAEPQKIAFRDRVLREDIAPLHLENAGNLPIFILQGGRDDNVPPIHARLSAKILEELGYEYIYKEVPNMGHWWNLEETPWVDCVDLPELMEFFKNHIRNPYPRHILFRTQDLGQTHRNGWVEIALQEIPYQDSRIEIKADEKTTSIETENIREFTLHLKKEVFGELNSEIEFRIDGKTLSHPFRKESPLAFRKKGNTWTIFQKKHSDGRKSPEFYGPMKQAYFSPFLLVYGTLGDSSSTEADLHQARLHALAWWMRGNGFSEILPDTEVSRERMDAYNLILFGGPERNWITRKIAQKLPITLKEGGVQLNTPTKKTIQSPNLVLQMIYPNPMNPNKFILLHAKTSPFGTASMGTLYSGAGLPDFILFDEEVKKKGWGGVIACGFFNHYWEMEEDLLFLNPDIFDSGR